MFSVLVLTCDNNIDLAPLIKQSLEAFIHSNIKCYISIEKNIEPYKLYNYVSTDGSFAKRMIEGLKRIEDEYVLILLDDFLIHDNQIDIKKEIWMKEIINNDFVALKIFSDGKIYKSLTKGVDGAKVYKKLNVYDIDFHPTIWKKDALEKILSNDNLSPWEIEPLFVKYLVDNKLKCGISSSKISYNELIVGGKFFRKPYFKYCKGIYKGNRKILTRRKNLFTRTKIALYHLVPRPILKIINKTFKKKTFSNSSK